MLSIVLSFLLLSSCAIVLSITVLKRAELVVEKQAPRHRYSVSVWPRGTPILCRSDLSSRRIHVESLLQLRSACNVAVASTIVAETELTIKLNKIQGVKAGHTMPLLMGVATVVRIVYIRLSRGPPRSYQDSHGGSRSTEAHHEGPLEPEPIPVDTLPLARIPLGALRPQR